MDFPGTPPSFEKVDAYLIDQGGGKLFLPYPGHRRSLARSAVLFEVTESRQKCFRLLVPEPSRKPPPSYRLIKIFFEAITAPVK